MGNQTVLHNANYKSGVMELKGCYHKVKFSPLDYSLPCKIRSYGLPSDHCTQSKADIIIIVALVCRQVEYGFTIVRTKFRIWEAAPW